MPKRHRKIEEFDRPLNLALYLRVSTEEQADKGFSLDSQIKRLKAYCKAHEFKVFKIYREEGESGRTIKRTKYREMMKDIDQWDGILVIKMDRVHRNSRNFMEMMDTFRDQGKHFISMMENLDTSTAMGRFVMDIIQRIAQLESEQIGERTYDGMKQKAETDEAGILGFNAPFGYDHIEGELVVVGDQAQVVRDIFDTYVEGKSLDSIAIQLNHVGVKTKKGNIWTRWSIGYILKNPIYAGWQNWDGTLSKGTHEAIIMVEFFNKAQRGRKKILIPEGD